LTALRAARTIWNMYGGATNATLRPYARQQKQREGAQLMKNVEMAVDGNILTIKVDLSKEFGPSSSGKTIIIASTEGNASIPGREDAKVGLNVYKKK